MKIKKEVLAKDVLEVLRNEVRERKILQYFVSLEYPELYVVDSPKGLIYLEDSKGELLTEEKLLKLLQTRVEWCQAVVKWTQSTLSPYWRIVEF